MAINTLITLRDALQAFADGHGQIQRIFFGADDKRAPLLTDAELFPALYVAPIDVVVGQAHNTHRLRIYVYERLDSSASDEWENANDTSLILRDIRVWWNAYGIDDILISEDPTGTFKTDSELDNLVGYYAEFLFEIPSHGRCDVPVSIEPIPPPPTCEDASYVVEYANGDPIESGSIPSGGSETIVVPNCPAVDPSDVYINGVEIGTTTNGEQFDITVEQGGIEVGSFIDGVWVVPECEPCEDAKAFLKDTDGNELSTTFIASGATADIIAPDATFDINGVQVATILSGGSDSIEVRRASGSTQVGSLQGQHWRIANTSVQLRDSANNNIGSANSYGAESSNNLTAPDGTVTVNRDGVFYATQAVRSNGTATINVPSAATTPKGQMPLKTFQTTPQGSGTDGDLEQGFGVSYGVLPYNNPFGNTNRFTAPDGSQTYTDAIACDWLTWNDSTNTVLMIHFGSAAGQVLAANRSLADGITYINTLTVGGYSGWNMINKNQLENIVNNEASINDLNVAPFNIGAVAIQTNTAYSATNRAIRTAAGLMNLSTSTARTLAVRIGTVAGTVIS
jgi:hypothetical protein